MILLFEPDRWGMGLFVRNVGGRSLSKRGGKGGNVRRGGRTYDILLCKSVSARLCNLNFLVASSKEWTSGQMKCNLLVAIV